MKITKMKLFRQLGIFLLLTACVSPIDFRIENTNRQIIISGQVSSLENRSFITIGRTLIGRLPEPETDAIVTLHDHYNNYLGEFSETNPGEYQKSGFQGIPGFGYTVSVTLKDGRNYVSEIEYMPEYAPSLTVNYKFNDRISADQDGDNVLQRYIDLYASSTLPEEWINPYLTWSVEENYLLSPTDFPDPFGSIPPPCFVFQKLAPIRRSMFDGSIVKTKEIEGLLIHERKVDRTFLEKHYFTVYQSSISYNAFTYWNKVNILAYSTGSIFETPPAQIIGNFRNTADLNEKVWGYLQVSNESFYRFFLHPYDFPYRVFFPTEDCTYDATRGDYPAYCINCLDLQGSSYTRPEWF